MVVNRMVCTLRNCCSRSYVRYSQGELGTCYRSGQGGRVLACAFAILATLFAWRFRRSIALRLRGLGSDLLRLAISRGCAFAQS